VEANKNALISWHTLVLQSAWRSSAEAAPRTGAGAARRACAGGCQSAAGARCTGSTPVAQPYLCFDHASYADNWQSVSCALMKRMTSTESPVCAGVHQATYVCDTKHTSHVLHTMPPAVNKTRTCIGVHTQRARPRLHDGVGGVNTQRDAFDDRERAQDERKVGRNLPPPALNATS